MSAKSDHAVRVPTPYGLYNGMPSHCTSFCACQHHELDSVKAANSSTLYPYQCARCVDRVACRQIPAQIPLPLACAQRHKYSDALFLETVSDRYCNCVLAVKCTQPHLQILIDHAAVRSTDLSLISCPVLLQRSPEVLLCKKLKAG